MPRLGVVGLVSLDRVDGGLPRLGGAPTYAARALRLLGHPTVLATKIADEDRARLRAIGLPVTARPTERTIAFRIENEGDRRSLALEALGEPWTPAEVPEWLAGALAGVDYVHAGALTRADFPGETLAALARGRRMLSLDGQALVRPARLGPVVMDAEYDPELLRHVRVLKLSEVEAEVLGLEPEAGAVRSLGVREVVVTLGAAGALVCADGTLERVPTRPLEDIDPTGAGDCWIAAYLSFRSRGHAPVSAARLANGTAYALLSQRLAA